MGWWKKDVENWIETVLGVDDLVETYEIITNEQYCRL